MIKIKLVTWLFAAMISIYTVELGASRPIKKIKVNQPLAGRLMHVLIETEAMHRALTNTNVKKRTPASLIVNEHIKSLLEAVNKAAQFSKLAGAQRVHLEKILFATRSRLQDAQTVSARNYNQKIVFVQESFRQIVQIAQMYDLDHNYKVFFCSKDRSVWLQSNSKPLYPFDVTGKLKACGVLMR